MTLVSYRKVLNNGYNRSNGKRALNFDITVPIYFSLFIYSVWFSNWKIPFALGWWFGTEFIWEYGVFKWPTYLLYFHFMGNLTRNMSLRGFQIDTITVKVFRNGFSGNLSGPFWQFFQDWGEKMMNREGWKMKES